MGSNAYEKAGVSLENGYESVRKIKKHVQRTARPGMMGNIGSFGGMFDLASLKYKFGVKLVNNILKQYKTLKKQAF